MQCDEIEIGQVTATAEFGKGLVEDLGLAAGDFGQLAGKTGVMRIEVRAIPLGRAGSRMGVQAYALTKTELAGLPDLRESQAGLQEGNRQLRRVQVRVIAIGVADVTDIAFGPGCNGRFLVDTCWPP